MNTSVNEDNIKTSCVGKGHSDKDINPSVAVNINPALMLSGAGNLVLGIAGNGNGPAVKRKWFYS